MIQQLWTLDCNCSFSLSDNIFFFMPVSEIQASSRNSYACMWLNNFTISARQLIASTGAQLFNRHIHHLIRLTFDIDMCCDPKPKRKDNRVRAGCACPNKILFHEPFDRYPGYKNPNFQPSIKSEGERVQLEWSEFPFPAGHCPGLVFKNTCFMLIKLQDPVLVQASVSLSMFSDVLVPSKSWNSTSCCATLDPTPPGGADSRDCWCSLGAGHQLFIEPPATTTQ